MNKKQLLKLGVPKDCIKAAIAAVQSAARQKIKPKRAIGGVLSAPEVYLADEFYGDLARALIQSASSSIDLSPIDYHSWGNDFDPTSVSQIQNACRLPIARGAALIPDAHSGYGLPIGGVLACENAIIPYGVGVDIACPMKLTITDLPVDPLRQNDPIKCRNFDESLYKGTLFGTGKKSQRPHQHAVLDEDWNTGPRCN